MGIAKKKGKTKTQQKYNFLQILALQHLLFQLCLQSGKFISIGHGISRSPHIQSSTQVPVVCNKCPAPHPALGTSLLPGAQGGDIKKQELHSCRFDELNVFDVSVGSNCFSEKGPFQDELSLDTLKDSLCTVLHKS